MWARLFDLEPDVSSGARAAAAALRLRPPPGATCQPPQRHRERQRKEDQARDVGELAGDEPRRRVLEQVVIGEEHEHRAHRERVHERLRPGGRPGFDLTGRHP